MGSKDKIINDLVLENAKLKAAAEQAVEPCRTCSRLERHDCGVFFVCPFLGIINPDGPGCQKYKGVSNGQE